MKKLILFIGYCLIFRLISAQQPKLMLPVNHSFLYDATFSNDGKYAVTAASDGTSSIWEVASGKCVTVLSGHTSTIVRLKFSPDGKLLATGSFDATMRIWDFVSGKQLYKFGYDYNINEIFFSSDNKSVIAANYKNKISRWDLVSGELLNEYISDYGDIKSVSLSHNESRLMGTYEPGKLCIWELSSGNLLRTISTPATGIKQGIWCNDGKKMAACFNDSSFCIWNEEGEELSRIKIEKGAVNCFKFSLSGDYIIAGLSNGLVMIWESKTGKLYQIMNYPGSSYNLVYTLELSKDSSTFITTFKDGSVKRWSIHQVNALNIYKGHNHYVIAARYSADEKEILTASYDYSARVWETSTGKCLMVFSGKTAQVYYGVWDSSNTKFAGAYSDGYVRIYETANGKCIGAIQAVRSKLSLTSVSFSPDGNQILTSSIQNDINIWDIKTGKRIMNFEGHSDAIEMAKYSNDGKLMISASRDKTARIWDVSNGKCLKVLSGHEGELTDACFSHNLLYALTTSKDKTERIWEVSTGKELRSMKVNNSWAYSKAACFNSTDSLIAITSWDNYITILNIATGEEIKKIKRHDDVVRTISFSKDSKRLLTASRDGFAKIVDIESEKVLLSFEGHSQGLFSAQFSQDEKEVLTSSDDCSLRIWDATTGDEKFSVIAIDSIDEIVLDKYSRFDGTNAARKSLYFTCGLEILNLEQIKDLCWEPGLVEKIMGGNKEPIRAKRLDEISICGNTPVIENMEDGLDQKNFKIKKRSGGLGEVALFINYKEVEKIDLISLKFNEMNETIISIDLKKYAKYLEPGKENNIQLQARTADLSISARGAALLVEPEIKETTAPNLYAIIAGVSDYKGSELDLKFAAKDASDFSNALQLAARKLLNIDGKEHVFMTTLVSGSSTPPIKDNIRKAFEDIKTKARANDIVIVYVSGHGEKYGTETTNFYYLTAEASSFNLSGIEKDVAISTNEFADWLKAIPARKQVLILDACASGKLAEDMAVAMRAAIPSDQIKALDRLNSRTGTFILSGAAANQSAYETSRYGQGLLTYSLLYGMKSGEALKNNSFVDIDQLFQYCADKVKDLAQGIGGIQEPVISKPLGGASFDVGKVDQEVAAKIILALPKMIFTNSKFSNRETDDDNFGLESAVDLALNDYASKGNDSKLVFTERSQLSDSYRIVGSYQISGNTLNVTVRLKKGTTEIRKFEVSGSTLDKEKLVGDIVLKIQSMIK